MDKGYYEFLVKGKPNTTAKVLKVVFVILAILSLAGALLLGNTILFILVIIFGAGTALIGTFIKTPEIREKPTAKIQGKRIHFYYVADVFFGKAFFGVIFTKHNLRLE